MRAFGGPLHSAFCILLHTAFSGLPGVAGLCILDVGFWTFEFGVCASGFEPWHDSTTVFHDSFMTVTDS